MNNTFSDTVIITSKEHMKANIEKLSNMLQQELGKGVNTRISRIVEMSDWDKNGNPIIRVTLEISNEITV